MAFPPLTQPGRLKQVSGRGDRAPATRLW